MVIGLVLLWSVPVVALAVAAGAWVPVRAVLTKARLQGWSVSLDE